MKLIKKEFVFHPDNPYFNVCHASTICLLPNNEMLAAWFGGTKEGSDDTAIWMSRQKKGKWSQPYKVAYDVKEPHWNPVFYQQKNGPIYLFYKVGKDISKWSTKIRQSNDNGITWTDPKELVPGDFGGRGPVRNKAITLSNGDIISGASLERGIWYAFADSSTAQLDYWTKSNHIQIEGIDYDGEKTVNYSDIEVSEQSFYGRGVIQPTLWESKYGHVHMLLRSTEGFIYRSDSNDYGKTWCKAYQTSLLNNNSGIDVVKTINNELLLCYNPIGENWGKRTPLNISISKDNGETWDHIFTLENESGEYSYPAIIAEDGRVIVSYTWNRQSIVVAQFHL